MQTIALGGMVQGRYAVIRLLGQGGMGAVYQVADSRIGGKLWAMKEMSDAAITNPQEKAAAVAAFGQEAQLLARLDHSNIPKVSDFFTEAGKHYLVMEFVPGEALDDRMARQATPFSEGDVRAWALQLCDVLQYLHDQNPPVIFRDLKPGNFMITPQGQLKLIDFGIARLFKPGKPGDTMVMGTPGYAPPEQYGKGQTDARSDVYSLGVVLHTLLTNHDPATTPFALPLVRQLNAAVSPQMEGVIQTATRLDPVQRYQTAAQMRAALTGHVAGATTVIPGSAQRQSWAVPAGVLLIAAVGLAIAAAAWSGANRAAPPPAPVTVVAGAVRAVSPTMTPSPARVSTPASTEAPGRSVGAFILPTDTARPPTVIPTPSTTTASPATATPAPSTPTRVPPTPTRVPPTATPVPPTPACSRPVDGQMSTAWDRGMLGCAVGATSIVWAAWQPFQGGSLLWRSDLNTVYVLTSDGSWFEIPDKWDGLSTASRGNPPSGLRAPERGFGWVWGTRADVFKRLGWALDQEKGYCTAVQPMERGFIFLSSRVQSCQDGLYNWATHPEFRPLFFRVAGDGSWKAY
jgi:serine/threonine-protein kinase